MVKADANIESETMGMPLKSVVKRQFRGNESDENLELNSEVLNVGIKVPKRDEESVLGGLPLVYRLPNVQRILNSISTPDYSGEEFIHDLEDCLEKKMYFSFAYYVIESSVQVLQYNKSLLGKVGALIQRATEEAHDQMLEHMKSRIGLLVLLTDPEFPQGYTFYPLNEEHIRKEDHLTVAINLRYFKDLPIIKELGITDEMLARVERECANVSFDQRAFEIIALRDA